MEKQDAKQLLDHIIEIQRTLGGLEAKIDGLDSKVDRHLDEDAAYRKVVEKRLDAIERGDAASASLGPTVEKHEDRLNKVERKQSWLIGIGVGIAFIAGLVVDLFWGGSGGHR